MGYVFGDRRIVLFDVVEKSVRLRLRLDGSGSITCAAFCGEQLIVSPSKGKVCVVGEESRSMAGLEERP